jgi:hypothetical protein
MTNASSPNPHNYQPDWAFCCIAGMFLVFETATVGSICFVYHRVSDVAWEVRLMLNNLSEQIRECLRHAEDCAQKAAAHTDPQTKQDFLDSEQSRLVLARSYGFTEQLTDFSNEMKRRKADELAPAVRPPQPISDDELTEVARAIAPIADELGLTMIGLRR